MTIEKTVLSHLVYNDEYARKVIPFLKEEYFHNLADKTVYNLIKSYVDRYNSVPSKEALVIELDQQDSISENIFKESKETIDNLSQDIPDLQWLVDSTEKFCQDKAIYNAIMHSIKIMDDKSGDMSKGSIPQLLSDALGVSFDVSIGHDYLLNSDSRYEFYHTKEDRIEFDLEYFNKITKGGLVKKSLNIALAGTGVGKSLFMCHCAAANLTKGLNVLYITMEMSEEKIAERIDANLLNVTTDELGILPKDVYDKKIQRVRNKTTGKLIIKEYPTASVGASHFRHLINELRIKRNFTPDIIYIDYLNICASSRLRAGSNINSYTYVKAIAEELRGLAVEYSVPIVSATQTTRSGYCLDLQTTIITQSGTKTISDIVVGDEVLSNSGWNTVKTVFPIVKKKMYRITTESGKEIVCSEDHLFPTEDGEKNIKSGLCLEDKLFINKNEV